jgi:hypothetical protein
LHGGDPDDPEYRELMIRWFQYGAFCPLFRRHGDRLPRMPLVTDRTGGPNEVWSYGDEAYSVICEVLALRERLRPYLMEQMQRAHTDGLPPMRPLFMDFPDDPGSWEVDDEFLPGPDVLVAPILEAKSNKREVYLPPDRWTDAWSGTAYEGPATIVADAPLARIPDGVVAQIAAADIRCRPAMDGRHLLDGRSTSDGGASPLRPAALTAEQWPRLESVAGWVGSRADHLWRARAGWLLDEATCTPWFIGRLLCGLLASRQSRPGRQLRRRRRVVRGLSLHRDTG